MPNRQIQLTAVYIKNNRLELMRPRDALPNSIATLEWCVAAFSARHLPIGDWASSPDHGGNHESRPTGSPVPLHLPFGSDVDLKHTV